MSVSYNSAEFTSEGERALDLPKALGKLDRTRALMLSIEKVEAVKRQRKSFTEFIVNLRS